MIETASNGEGDRILLTLPGSPRLRGVATLVLGGVGSRLDLPYEKVDDLQLAVLSVMAANDLDTVTIRVQVAEQEVDVSIGPLPEGGSADEGLRRVLERLVDRVEPGRDAALQAATGGMVQGEAPTSAEWITLRLARAEADSAS